MKWSEMTPEERDRLVAEKVMGWQEKQCESSSTDLEELPGEWRCGICGFTAGYEVPTLHTAIPPKYSTDMNAAMCLVEKCHQDGLDVSMYVAQHTKYGVQTWKRSFDALRISASSDSSMQEAICFAVLHAYNKEIGNQ